MSVSKKKILSFIDLTSLNSTDTEGSIEALAQKTRKLFLSENTVAAVCVYPSFASTVKAVLSDTIVKTAVVGACFPASQSFLDVKKLECEQAVKNGADEVDIVINLGLFFDEKYAAVIEEIKEIKSVIKTAKLKVIIESGLLKPSEIEKATEIAIKGGADFVKTSTGKVETGATPEAVENICKTIARLDKNNSRKTGVKVSGGVRSYDDAVKYYSIVEKELGASYLTPDFFRIGASSLVSNLLNEN